MFPHFSNRQNIRSIALRRLGKAQRIFNCVEIANRFQASLKAGRCTIQQ
jgi:hypothetical protein